MDNSNDQTQSNTEASGNTNTYRSRCFFFTLNNPTEAELSQIRNTSNTAIVDQLVGQMELGANGTPHAQFCIKYHNPRFFHNVKEDWPRAHIERCRNWLKAVQYCSKNETRNGETWGFVPIHDPIAEPREWQQNILNILNEEPNDRSIVWVVDIEGNQGKTALCKHICLTNPLAVYVTGKAADVKYMISNMKIPPRIVL